MALTAKQRAMYLSNPYHCPYCGTEQIEGGNIDIDNCQAWQEIHCLECSKEWIDVYSLTDVEEKEE
jgi:transcription elongation factor Elf1